MNTMTTPKNYTMKNAIIESAQIVINDHGFLDCWLTLDYGGGSHQGFGGWVLALPQTSKNFKKQSPAGLFIMKCMEVGGVEEFSQLVGKAIRVESCQTSVRAIGHITKDIWLCPEKDLQGE